MSKKEKVKAIVESRKFPWVLVVILLFAWVVYYTRDFWTPLLTPNPEKLKEIVWVIPTKQFLGHDIELRVGEFIASWDWPDIIRFVVSLAIGGVGGIVGVWKKYVTPLFGRVKELEEENRTLKEKLEGLLLGKVTPEEVAKKIKPPEKKVEEKPKEKPAEKKEEKKEEKAEEVAPTPEEVEKAIAILEAYRKLKGKK